MDSKLEHEVFDCPEDCSVMEKADLDHVVETIGAVRSPRTIDFDNKITFGRFKFRKELFWRGGISLTRIKQARVSIGTNGNGHVVTLDASRCCCTGLRRTGNAPTGCECSCEASYG